MKKKKIAKSKGKIITSFIVKITIKRKRNSPKRKYRQKGVKN